MVRRPELPNSLEGIETLYDAYGEMICGGGRNSQIPWKGLKLVIFWPSSLHSIVPELPNSLEGIETRLQIVCHRLKHMPELPNSLEGIETVSAVFLIAKAMLGRNSQIPWKGLKHRQSQHPNRPDTVPELPNSLEGIETC